MPETLNLTRERAAKHYEIIHHPNIDAVVNNDSAFAHLAPAIAEAYKDGLEQVPEGWEQAGNHIWMAVGEVDGVKLFTKPKAFSGDAFYEQKQAIYENAARYRYGKKEIQYGIRTRQLLNSVLNEIAMSPLIKNLVNSEDSQRLAKNRGLNSYSFVEPIVGLVDKLTQERSIIFPYIEDAVSLASNLGEERVGLRHDGKMDDRPNVSAHFINPFISFFNDRGIDPGDLCDRQFLVDGNKNFYLIDAEMYRRLSPIELEELRNYQESNPLTYVNTFDG